MEAECPVFVVGMARSGTTLIGTMIGAHPELTIAPETHFLDRCFARAGRRHDFSEEELAAVWREYAEEERFRVLGLDAGAIERRLRAERIRDLAAMYRVLLRAYAAHLGRSGWGDKTHLDHEFVEWLLASYSGARIVCVIRDPRATVASLLKAPWSSGKAFYYALQWRDTMRIVRSFNANSRVIAVRYEDAVTSPEETLSRICGFLGIEEAPEMIERAGDPAPVAQGEQWALGDWWREHKAKAMGPITTESLDRWKTELSAYELAAIEHLCRVDMQAWGYVPTTEEIAPGQAVRLFGERVARIVRGALRRRRMKDKTIFRPRF